MKHFERVYSAAVQTHGVITSSRATSLGVSPSELNRFCKDGRLSRSGHGVYRLTHYVPTARTRYVEAVAIVGKGAYLCGGTALALYGLADPEPGTLCVASKARVRKALPDWLRLRKARASDVCVEYDGVPVQTVCDAVLSCACDLSASEMLGVVEEAGKRKLISDSQRRELLEQLGIACEPSD